MDPDARSLRPAAQEELRRAAVRLLGEGRSQVEVARMLSVSRPTVGRWLAVHRQGGDAALAPRRRGRRPGHTKLSEAEQRLVLDTLLRHNPDGASLSGWLWSRSLVRELIRLRLEVEVSDDTVSRYLHAWGLYPADPMRQAQGRPDDAARQWLTATYSDLQRRAAHERARVVWAVESSVRSEGAGSIASSAAGAPPTRPGAAHRMQAHIIAAVPATGAVRFGSFDDRYTRSALLDFADRLIRESDGRKVFLVLDGHPSHRTRVVRDWVSAHADHLELHFLPDRVADAPASQAVAATPEPAAPVAPAGGDGQAPAGGDGQAPAGGDGQAPAREPEPEVVSVVRRRRLYMLTRLGANVRSGRHGPRGS